MASDEVRVRIIEATLALAAERSLLDVSLADIAARSGVSLVLLRGRYADRIAILTDFAAYIDEQVLSGGEAEAGEPPRERLLDVMMRRFDALAPYRSGLAGIRKAAMRDPLFAATLNHIAVGSQKWMLAAARLEPSGRFAPVRRLARAEALVLVTASVLPTFLADTSPDLPRTMAALDSALQRLDRVANVVTRMESFVDRICDPRPNWRRGTGGPRAEDAPPKSPDGPSGSPKPAGVYTSDEIGYTSWPDSETNAPNTPEDQA